MVMSVLCLGLLVMRRMSPIFGRAELGGPVGPKVATAIFLILLWLIYIALSIAQVSGTI
jgi:solute carrier family 8 (sodium/calcium exchanger)